MTDAADLLFLVLSHT